MSLSVSRMGVAIAVGAAHLCLGVGLLRHSPLLKDGGGAPVILVTLESVARFDGDDGAEDSTDGAVESGGGGAEAPARPASAPRPVDPIRDHAPDILPAGTIAEPAPRAPVPSATTATSAASSAPGQGAGDGGAGGAAGDRNSRAGRTGGGGALVLGAQAAPVEDRYGAEVIAWIERHKRHPGGGASGVVQVSFVLDRQGRLRRAGILGRSGSTTLDQTALSQLTAMQPFPKPPPGTRWARRDFAVAIDYRIR